MTIREDIAKQLGMNVTAQDVVDLTKLFKKWALKTAGKNLPSVNYPHYIEGYNDAKKNFRYRIGEATK